ncbi:MAG: AraC family transcriptional regulator [Candidatus Pelagadaptatus aseana]|uniref:AraC family transcriptional regulator n=1 Tax=Candidatus Pelagadaptatus aseana TaxID=3120508 RepID=UPI0039B335AD
MSASSFIHHLRYGCRHLLQEGHDIDQLLAGSGLTPAHLEEIYGLASAEQFQTVFSNYLSCAGQEVSFQLANKLRLSDLGPLGYLLLSSATLEEALYHLQRFTPLIGPLLQLDMRFEGDCARIQLHSPKSLDPAVHRYTVEYLITVFNRCMSELRSAPLIPVKLELMHSEPGAKQTYCMLPIREILFGQNRDCVSYALADLRQPLPFSDPEMKACTEQLCKRLMLKLEQTTSFGDKVKAILSDQPGDYPDIGNLAARLDMSARSLRRHLADEGTSYQELVSEHRQNLAISLLRYEHLPIQSVAYACGFSEVQNFSAAFKRWSGLSPTQFRNQLQQP